MIMADILFWFLVIVGLVLTTIAHWLGAQALLPQTVARSAQAYGQRPVACCLIGVGVGLPTSLILLTLMGKVPAPPLQILCVLLLCGLALLGFIGSAGLAQRVGQGLPAATDAQAPWRATVRGGFVLCLIYLLPIMGWFVLLPLTIFSGLGAWMLGRKVVLREASSVATVVHAAPA